MTKALLLGAAAALVFAGGASAAGHGAKPTLVGKSTPHYHIVLPKGKSGVIYSQRDNDNGVGIVSQMFTDFTSGAYDAQGADDFSVKKKATVTEVDVDGTYFNGSGPADSVNVTFYADSKGKPGKAVATCANSSYTDETGFGTFDIKLGGKCKKGVKLKKGTYWVSAQAVMAFGNGGEWGWNTNNTVRGTASVWQNPGGGFGTSCSTYTTTTTCIAAGEGGDYSFALLGKGK